MRKLYNLTKEPEALLCDLINHTNKTEFDTSHFNFSAPYNRSDGRCQVTVSPQVGTVWKGKVEVDYRRLNLTFFFASRGALLLIDESKFVDGVITDTVILEELLEQHGILFIHDQVYISLIEQPDPENPGSIRTYFTITPKPNHLVWEGTLVGEYRMATLTSDVITTTSLDGLNDPEGLTDTTFPIEYLYYGKIDGTPYVNDLMGLEAGFVFMEPPEDGLWTLGHNITGDVWTYQPVATVEHNVYNSIVEYNGINDGEWGVDTLTFNRVLVITVSPDFNQSVAGHLVIPYNEDNF
jgi:hypothetical protein